MKNSLSKGGKIFLFSFILSVLFLSLVEAQPPFQAGTGTVGMDIRSPPIEFIKLNRDIIANTHAFNKSNGLPLTNTTTDCFLHLFNQTGSHVLDEEMVWEQQGDFDDFDWELLIKGGNFSSPGEYGFVIQCNSTLIGGFVSSAVIVTPTGFGNLIGFYIIIFGISIIILIIGFWIRDPWVVILGSFGFYFLGLYVLLNGIVGIRDLVYTRAIGIILLAVAAYISIKSAQEAING